MNQMTTKVMTGHGGESSLVPALGESWAHAATNRWVTLAVGVSVVVGSEGIAAILVWGVLILGGEFIFSWAYLHCRVFLACVACSTVRAAAAAAKPKCPTPAFKPLLVSVHVNLLQFVDPLPDPCFRLIPSQPAPLVEGSGEVRRAPQISASPSKNCSVFRRRRRHPRHAIFTSGGGG